MSIVKKCDRCKLEIRNDEDSLKVSYMLKHKNVEPVWDKEGKRAIRNLGMAETPEMRFDFCQSCTKEYLVQLNEFTKD